jgi:hypothetical protein
MKNKIILLLLTLNLYSCAQGQEKNNINSTNIDKDLYEKINGEWAVLHSWTDSVLIFENKKDKKFKQAIFPTFNTITFNKKNRTIEQKTYGEFGCGTAALQNLEIQNSKWNFENGHLHLSFEYSDYSGENILDNIYSIERKGQILTLKKIK